MDSLAAAEVSSHCDGQRGWSPGARRGEVVGKAPTKYAIRARRGPHAPLIRRRSRPRSTADLHTLLGRDRELAALRHQLRRGARLVTLLGTFGVGKSQIARHFAGLHARPNYVHWCDLAAATDPRELVSAIARALALPLDAGAATAIATVGQAIAALGPGTLVVFDDVDRALDPLAACLTTWLTLAPGASFVVTARQPLGLHTERCLPISPLTEADAVTLFVRRMLAIGGAAAITDIDRACVAQIVRELDGIPLALEMAAARTRVLRPADLLPRLAHRFDLLRSERRDIPAHHATLALAITRSWALLSPWEAAALGQCSLFPGPVTLAAAEATLDLGAFADAPPVLDILQRLVQRSLIHTIPPGDDGEARIALSASLRAFVAARVDPQILAAAAERYALFQLAWAEPLAESLNRHYSRPALDRLGREFAGLRNTAERHVSAPETACRAALVLDTLLTRRGPLLTRLALLEACATALALLPVALRIRLLHALARALADHGRLLAAIAALEQALELARADDDVHTTSRLLLTLVELLRASGRFTRAASYQIAAETAAHASGDELLLAAVVLATPLNWGNQDLAQAIAATRGTRPMHALPLYQVGLRALFNGELHEALADFQEARRVAASCEDASGELHMRWLVAATRHALGDSCEAAELYDEIVGQLEATGRRRHLGLVLALWGVLRLGEWRLGEARDLLERSRSVAGETTDIYAEALALAALAALDALAGRLAVAELHLATAQALAASIDRAGVTMALGVGVELLGGVVELGRGRAAAARGDTSRALTHRAEAELLLARLPALRRGRDCCHSIVLGQILERAMLEEHAGARPSPRPIAQAPAAHASQAKLEVAVDGSWFRVRPDPPVDLGRHVVLRRVLIALATHRVGRPGHPLPATRLIATAWPDERIDARAALNRLHNAIAVLRAKGLRGVLRTTDEGYLLDSLVAVVTGELAAPAPL